MAELRNAQRVTYKATYNQISPTATVHGTTDAAGARGGSAAARLRQGRIRAVAPDRRGGAADPEEGDVVECGRAAAYCSRRGPRQRPHRVVHPEQRRRVCQGRPAGPRRDRDCAQSASKVGRRRHQELRRRRARCLSRLVRVCAGARARARPCVRRAPRCAEGQRHRARYPDPHDGRPRHAGTQVPRSGGHGDARGRKRDDRDRRDEGVAVGVLAEPRGRGARDLRAVEGRGTRLGVHEPAEAVLRPRHEASAVPRADARRARRGRRARGAAQPLCRTYSPSTSTTPRCRAPPPASSRG